jgi:hypothetical protein
LEDAKSLFVKGEGWLRRA